MFDDNMHNAAQEFANKFGLEGAKEVLFYAMRNDEGDINKAAPYPTWVNQMFDFVFSIVQRTANLEPSHHYSRGVIQHMEDTVQSFRGSRSKGNS